MDMKKIAGRMLTDANNQTRKEKLQLKPTLNWLNIRHILQT